MLMSKFLTLMPQVIIVLPVPEQSIENMSCARNVRMKLGFVKLNRVLFTPLIFSATGGMALFYKPLASLLSDKWDSNYVAVMGWVQRCLSFSLLRSAITYLRGSRSSKGSFGNSLGLVPIDLIQVESKVAIIHIHNNSFLWFLVYFFCAYYVTMCFCICNYIFHL